MSIQLTADGYAAMQIVEEETSYETVLISRAQLAAIHRLARVARHCSYFRVALTADERRQLRQAADQVDEA